MRRFAVGLSCTISRDFRDGYVRQTGQDFGRRRDSKVANCYLGASNGYDGVGWLSVSIPRE